MAVEKPIAHTFVVAGVVLEHDGTYLLVQEKQPRAYGLWNLPAGRVDEGDTIEQTAVKEAIPRARADRRFPLESGKAGCHFLFPRYSFQWNSRTFSKFRLRNRNSIICLYDQ